MQLFKNAVLSAPTNFLALLCCRQAVRLACFAAASPPVSAGFEAGVALAATAIVAGAGVSDATGFTAQIRNMRHRALAANAGRMTNPQNGCYPHRIAFEVNRTHEARMKLR
jgi:hypothetical protein